VIGLGYAVVYYVLFRVVIRRCNLRTPGREEDADGGAAGSVAADTAP
jgi:PTS system N-acetylglucosamine-specific IIC component